MRRELVGGLDGGCVVTIPFPRNPVVRAARLLLVSRRSPRNNIAFEWGWGMGYLKYPKALGSWNSGRF